METTPLSNSSYNQKEPIPGYKIQDRLGAGGYGEVWKSEAPGGLFKAIKFVYGTMNDTRATREMKSLNRIKEVHHPFLLSLERIEVIDGHLIIVTELADCSIKDRFDECKSEGLTGIPRDELLIYLRDTADALDYIYEQHSLQHLDVKPENLLLLGNRVKVADFGLLKDLHETSASMVGGMTPLYAPPELFDGRPNRHSDQYSLAIVYQEMLTGDPPFTGTSTAQLAAQHIHSAPTLSPLPKSDQAVIAKALSKDPDKRFPNCRAMVDRLLNPDRIVVSKGVKSRPVEKGRSRKRINNEDTKWTPTNTPTPLMLPPGKVADLPPLELQAGDVKFEPTLFIGIGGTGGKTLRRIRQRIHDRFGDADKIPTLQMLVVDTDLQELSELAQSTDGIPLNDRDLVPIPLRPPKDYRADSKRLLESISRRWIYNIPRSLQTEGVRPLGRLAFVDHFDNVFARLQAAILNVTDSKSIETALDNTGIEFQAKGPPKIYIVSSISGGTGSGIALDLTYAVRQILLDLGMPDDRICGIFTHSTSRKSSARDLSISSAFSFMRELQHFSNVTNSYPGDAGCGLLAFHDNNCPYRDAYLLHLGDELSAEEFDTATDALAEYLYRDAATSTSDFFRKSREEEHQEAAFPLSERRLRTFWLSRLGAPSDEIICAEEKRLCAALFKRWFDKYQPKRALGNKASLAEISSLIDASTTDEVEDQSMVERVHRVNAVCAEYASTHNLDAKSILKKVGKVLKREIKADPAKHLMGLVRETLSRYPSHPPAEGHLLQPRKEALDTIDSVIGVGTAEANQNFDSLKVVLRKNLRELSDRHSTAICDWIIALFNATTTPIKDGEEAAQWFIDVVSTLEESAQRSVKTSEQQAIELAQALLAPAPIPAKDGKTSAPAHKLDHRVFPYAKARLEQVLHGVVYEVAHSIRGQVAEFSRDMKLLENEVRMLVRAIDANLDERTECPVTRQLNQWRVDLVDALHKDVRKKLSGGQTLYQMLKGGPQVRDDLRQVVRDSARVLAVRAVKEASMQRLIQQLTTDDEEDRLTPEACMREIVPHLAHCGGDRRLLLVVPEGEKGQIIRERILDSPDISATVIEDSSQDVMFCCEMQNVPLDAAAGLLVGSRHYCIEVAHRLRSRIDVEWSSIST